MFSRLCLIGSVMLMTSNIVGQHLATDAAYIKRLKDQLFVLVDAVENRSVFNEIRVEPEKCSHYRNFIAPRVLHRFVPDESEKTWGVWRTVTSHLSIRLS